MAVKIVKKDKPTSWEEPALTPTIDKDALKYWADKMGAKPIADVESAYLEAKAKELWLAENYGTKPIAPPAPAVPKLLTHLTHKQALGMLYQVMFGKEPFLQPSGMQGMLFNLNGKLQYNFHKDMPPEKLYAEYQKQHLGFATLKDLQAAVKAALDAPEKTHYVKDKLTLQPNGPSKQELDFYHAQALKRLTGYERSLLLKYPPQLINAIKEVRMRVGCALHEAKKLVDMARGSYVDNPEHILSIFPEIAE